MTDASTGDEVIRPVLAPDEQIRFQAEGIEGLLALTDRRLLVADAQRVLDVEVDQIRRIQFDIERRRPTTLVIVPEHPSNQPLVLSSPPEQYAAASEALAMIGQRLAED
jgi:hypothetical protein